MERKKSDKMEQSDLLYKTEFLSATKGTSVSLLGGKTTRT
jgi:hypothetical protein